MAWNEPPSGNNDKDPWGNPKRGKNDGPPDLDELLKKINKSLGGLFGGGGGGNKNSQPSAGPGNSLIFGALIILGGAYMAYNSVYTVDARERGVVLRLGKFHEITEPGLQFKLPLVDSVSKVVVTDIREYSDKSRMLTQDQNIVEVSYNVQWQAADAKSFTLNVKDPARVLQHASESALRHVVGNSLMAEIMTSGRAQLASDMQDRLQSILSLYGAGIAVSQVNFADVSPPQEVRPAYDDVIKAEADEQRFINEAERYANQIVPEARGQAQRQIEEANGYKEEIIARAQGEAQRFRSLYREYSQAPEVTRERLYLETLSDVFGKTGKVLVDVDGGNNMMYLPLDQLRRSTAGNTGDRTSTGQSGTTPAAIDVNSNLSTSDISNLTDQIIDEFRRRGLIRSNN